MSITKAQAAAIADGFLDDVGSGEVPGLQLTETYTELIMIAGEFVADAQENLQQSNSDDTGALSESLHLDEPVQFGNIVRVDVLMKFYGRFVNKGVRGLKAGRSTAGYSFKTPFPSENMVKAFQNYVGGAARRTAVSDVKKYGAYGNKEKKDSALAGSNAYALARAVKMKGIKPTGFLDKATVTAVARVRERLSAALKIDIITSINQP